MIQEITSDLRALLQQNFGSDATIAEKMILKLSKYMILYIDD